MGRCGQSVKVRPPCTMIKTTCFTIFLAFYCNSIISILNQFAMYFTVNGSMLLILLWLGGSNPTYDSSYGPTTLK